MGRRGTGLAVFGGGGDEGLRMGSRGMATAQPLLAQDTYGVHIGVAKGVEVGEDFCCFRIGEEILLGELEQGVEAIVGGGETAFEQGDEHGRGEFIVGVAQDGHDVGAADGGAHDELLQQGVADESGVVEHDGFGPCDDLVSVSDDGVIGFAGARFLRILGVGEVVWVVFVGEEGFEVGIVEVDAQFAGDAFGLFGLVAAAAEEFEKAGHFFFLFAQEELPAELIP